MTECVSTMVRWDDVLTPDIQHNDDWMTNEICDVDEKNIDWLSGRVNVVQTSALTVIDTSTSIMLGMPITTNSSNAFLARSLELRVEPSQDDSNHSNDHE